MNTPLGESRARRVAIVTGGSRGVGRAIVGSLASGGYAVVVNYLHDGRTADAAVDMVLAGRGAAVAVRADVADELDVERLFSETIATFGGIDVLVHTVRSSVLATPLAQSDLEEFDALCRINTRGVFIVDREAARLLRDGGAIVNLTRSVASSALATHAVDAASEAAMGALTRGLAVELRDRDITANVVSIGLDLPYLPGDVADVVLYLLSDEGHGRTGEAIRVEDRVSGS